MLAHNRIESGREEKKSRQQKLGDLWTRELEKVGKLTRKYLTVLYLLCVLYCTVLCTVLYCTVLYTKVLGEKVQ